MNIVLFEPWGLGDVAIAVSAFRGINIESVKLIVVCDYYCVEWVSSLSWISKVIPVHIPWTEKRGKYCPSKYHYSDFIALRKNLINCLPNYICEIRGDLRNFVLMKLLNVSPVVTLCNGKFNNRYDRPLALLDKLSISMSKKIIQEHDQSGIVFFFGAAWKNREVPNNVAESIIRELLVLFEVNIVIVLQPSDDINAWSILFDFSDNISIVQDSLCSVATIISKSALVVSTDSSWLHIAQTYGVATVGFYGFNNAPEWAPPGCEVICPEVVLPAKDRYNLNNESICPLAELNPKLVAQIIYNKYVNTIKT